MKKFNFFSEEFLNECDAELGRMIDLIEAQKFTFHPSAMNDEELQLQKIFANRILTVLYHGNRISQKDWISGLYVIDTLGTQKNAIK